MKPESMQREKSIALFFGIHLHTGIERALCIVCSRLPVFTVNYYDIPQYTL